MEKAYTVRDDSLTPYPIIVLPSNSWWEKMISVTDEKACIHLQLARSIWAQCGEYENKMHQNSEEIISLLESAFQISKPEERSDHILKVSTELGEIFSKLGEIKAEADDETAAVNFYEKAAMYERVNIEAMTAMGHTESEILPTRYSLAVDLYESNHFTEADCIFTELRTYLRSTKHTKSAPRWDFTEEDLEGFQKECKNGRRLTVNKWARATTLITRRDRLLRSFRALRYWLLIYRWDLFNRVIKLAVRRRRERKASAEQISPSVKLCSTSSSLLFSNQLSNPPSRASHGIAFDSAPTVGVGNAMPQMSLPLGPC